MITSSLMKVTLLVGDRNSWIFPYARQLQKQIADKHDVKLIFDLDKIENGDLLFMLSVGKIVLPDLLKRNKHNLVVHESDLPRGRGWAPLTWQILEGKKKIKITLFEAMARVDRGQIYYQDEMQFMGDELADEMREVQGEKTVELVLKFIDNFPNVIGREQKGKSTYYPRRSPKDSELDINKSIKEQFNLLRTVDNKRYPAFFNYLGKKYILKIYKMTK